MTTILHIDSSISGSESVSAELGQTLVDGIKASDTHVQYRNVSSENIPHFNAGTIAALSEGKAELADTYIKEVQEADIVVIGAPMYNFGIPTQLKSWFDHIARAGTTFKYTDTGPVGLLTGKKVYVITTSGGEHRNTPRDGVEPWLQTMLGFLGLNEDLQFLRVAGLARSATKEQARETAHEEINEIISSYR